MAAKDIKSYQFKKGQSGNPNGRPKNRVPETLVNALKLSTKRELTATMNDVEVRNWEEFLLSASSDDIQILAQDASIPIYARSLARAIILDLKNGKTATLDKLRDRVFGKEIQKVELTGKDGAELMPARRLTKEEAKELLQELNDKY